MKVKLGISPIGWTNDDIPELGGQITFEQCINEMAQAGYHGCEVGNKFPMEVEPLRNALNSKGLKICNQWFSYTLTTQSLNKVQQEFDRYLTFLQAMGAGIVGGGECGNSIHTQPLAILDHQVTFTDRQWNKLTQGLNELGKQARDHGLKLAFHHHMGTGVQSMKDTIRLMDSTHQDLVYLNYDCGHFAFAGDDPVAALDTFISRVAHVHLKDIRKPVLIKTKDQALSFLESVVEGVFTVPGDPQGSIDFTSLFHILERANYQGWLVVEAEQDPAKANPLEYALMAKKYIANLVSAEQPIV